MCASLFWGRLGRWRGRLNLALGATVNTYVAAVKSFLGFAHRVGFTRFNAGPLIKLKKAPRQIAQRILSEVSVAMLIGAAKTDRDRLMFDLLRGTARLRAGQLDVGSGHWARQRRGAT
ncbi:MAG TPA: hypothetical protein VFI48_06030 [Hyphomicrobiaceae bacterium]|jgi:site-specific recombinase XerD|nr:hypothetical protein [Hyphomicrobiaceae bacterium]